MNDVPITLKFSRRNLPHWLVADRSYFVTIRLHGSLPVDVVTELVAERDQLVEVGADSSQVYALQRRQFLRVEKIMDCASAENQWLKNPAVADLVMKNLDWLHVQKGWRIYAAVILSNHVHLLMRNELGRSADLLSDLGPVS
jgi:hypothetical protein